VDWTFLKELPDNSRWVVTESGYYVKDFSESELSLARKFLEDQSKHLSDESLFGIHTLLNPDRKPNATAMYDVNGLTPVGHMIKDWLEGKPTAEETESPSDEPITNKPDPKDPKDEKPSSSAGEVTLVNIYPEYGGFFDWIHFNQTLVFSNGKTYKRSYWFGEPDFSKADVGKPITYFKRVLKNK
jgi:hypothetical protein